MGHLMWDSQYCCCTIGSDKLMSSGLSRQEGQFLQGGVFLRHWHLRRWSLLHGTQCCLLAGFCRGYMQPGNTIYCDGTLLVSFQKSLA